MPGKAFSTVVVIFCLFSGGLIGQFVLGTRQGIMVFCGGGLLIGLGSLLVLWTWLKMEPERIIGGTLGVLVGAVLAVAIDSGLSGVMDKPGVGGTVSVTLFIILGLIGMQLGASTGGALISRRNQEKELSQVIGILDTSVIIDGRIADVCNTGFLNGDLVIPEFILRELQMIADSEDSSKRTRGRRGLDILNRIRKQPYVNIIIDGTDYGGNKEVDRKLIDMAKETGHAILTNDYNLNKVADVHSIQVLNINQLAIALKPVVLPGEIIKVKIIKEGKEPVQGLAYLDDGTMVVVDHGRRHIGKNAEVSVTSVLQTTAGRMIFADLKT